MQAEITLCLLLVISVASQLQHVCFDTATRNETSGRCICPQPQVGDGNLCCNSDGRDFCTLKGDPVLKSLFGERAFVDFPCTTRMSSLTTRSNSWRRCQINVFSSGKFVEKGFIMNTAMSIEISIDFGRSKFLKFVEGKFIDPMGVAIDEASTPHTFTVDDIKFKLSFDAKNKLWEITSDCDLQVNFRKPEGEDPIQERPPGICVMTKPDASTGRVSDGNACNLDNSFVKELFPSVDARLLANHIVFYSFLQDQQKIDSPQMGAMCDNLVRYFRDCSLTQKPKAMLECSNILVDAVTRRCLSAKKVDIFGTFIDCIGAYCSKDRNSCDRLKANPGAAFCLKSVTKCDTWLSGLRLNLNLGL